MGGDPTPSAGPLAFSAASTCAVIITYHPDLALLRRVVDSVATQVGRVVVFDNGSPQALELAQQLGTGAQLVVEVSPVNIGLGAALNRGCALAARLGCHHVLLMDQDSVLASGMVATLGRALEIQQQIGPVAAVGPQFIDDRSGAPAPFVRFGFPINHKLRGGPGQTVSCDFLITSGSLIPLRALDLIGAMDEQLFIDNIDMEWCFRAKATGHVLLGVCDAQMRHSIGEALLASRVKRDGVVVHKPFRLYFIMRNRVLLYRRRQTPRVWIAQDIPRLVLKFIGNGLFLPERRERMRFMLRGLRDGALGRSGGLPLP